MPRILYSVLIRTGFQIFHILTLLTVVNITTIHITYKTDTVQVYQIPGLNISCCPIYSLDNSTWMILWTERANKRATEMGVNVFIRDCQ